MSESGAAGSDVEAAVTAAMGGSLLADDRRGRPARAGAVLDEHPPRPLLRGIVETLAGEPAAAARHLGEAAASGDGPTRARAAVWAAAVAGLRANTFPGDVVASGVEVTARWPDLARHPAPPDDLPPALELERRVLLHIRPFVRLVRTQLVLGRAHHDPPTLSGELLELLAATAEAFAGPDPALAAALLRQSAELRSRAGDAEAAHRSLAELRRDADARGDHAAVGAVELLLGDLALAPFSHPEVADLAPLDGGATSALPWSVEGAEADPASVDVSSAARAYTAAEAAYALADAPRGLAAVLLRRAGLARHAAEHDAAVELADRAAAVASEAGDRLLAYTARIHGLLGRVAGRRPTTSLSLPEELAAWATSTGSYAYAAGLGLVLTRSGRQWSVRAGDPDRAITCHELAGRVAAGLDARLQRSQSLADRAALAVAIGDTDAAVRDHERALEVLATRLDEPAFRDEAWRRSVLLGHELHNVHLAAGDADGMRVAIDRLRALVTAAPEPEPDDEVATLVHAQLLLHARSTIEDGQLRATLLEGDTARDGGDAVAAEERYADALALAETRGDDLGRAMSLARLGRVDEAREAYRVHEVAEERREAELAEPHGTEPGSVAGDGVAAHDLRLRRRAAFLTRIGAADAAAETFDALEDRDPGWWRTETRGWELLSDHGHVRELCGELERATDLHGAATAALEELEANVARDEVKVALNAGSARVFGRAARAALRTAELPGDDHGRAAGRRSDPPAPTPRERSFLLAERGRARALAGLLAPRRPRGVAVDGHPARHQRTVDAWMAASARLTMWQQARNALGRGVIDHDAEARVALTARVEQAERELAAATDQLRADAPELADAMAAPAPWTLDELCADLPPGGVLVSHLVVDDDLLTFAVTAAGLTVADRREVDARELRRTLRAFARGCSTGGEWVAAGRATAQLLLPPVAELLEDAARLTFVPTGVGHTAPLHALPWGDGVLLERAPVAVLPSAATLRHLAAPRTGGGGHSLVVGDPEGMVASSPAGGSPQPQPRLPFARAEAGAVAGRLPDPTLLLGADATGVAVAAGLGEARFVHLATHAQVDPVVPAATALLLAHGDLLRVVDLIGTRLRAELVVLSACDSGRGRVTGGDEVLGMTRALLAAGAGSAVVSLWPVDDLSTSLLLTRFAAALTDGRDAASALAEAQRWYRTLDAEGRGAAIAALRAELAEAEGRRGIVVDGPSTIPAAHPYHWAPFTYVGAHPTASVPGGR